MNISIACPEAVRKALSTDDANNHGAADVVTTTIEGSLLSFEIAGTTLEARLESVRYLDAEIGLAIADEDRPEMIAALSALKVAVGQLLAIVTRESSYIDTRENNYLTRGADELAAEVTEAATDTVVSHLNAEQHTSTSNASEQHGAEPDDEENEIEQAEEQQEQPARQQRRR